MQIKNIYFPIIVISFAFFSCKSDKRYHDEKSVEEEKPVAEKSVLGTIEEFQKELNAEFADAERSPLTEKDRKRFQGLDFFPIDTTYSVTAVFERTPNEKPFMMPTTTDRKTEEVRYGIVKFDLHGKEFQLNIYQNQQLKLTEEYRDYLFLPFSDLTNGEETYGGGRYIDLRIPKGDSIVIDFNKAYNPYCAYNEKYSCPLVPAENNLDYAVRVGVKKFKS
ncbi:DUF1684 domain-containing protein [Galbibacter sp. EGI 63066]|uniref:DUF1684 domain-containing protein n=1 Tax=Galbibacter sp. EGI 63066 TaxID=2993559 RepID=UPI002249057C|nr:DUF1684 domain-containing protein [Galbibacter sp. EGI 63066]MCX2681539.1 DUF1684 domain-containing protein [Galbibacter sp. EGI 63066]